mmetsp:Transcript_25957/g.37999  ORF Transcript_25957/g.37999 Transcript_25957/m.37999 type:complete len:242 (+) Transcript_25957:1122-1847(+)
MGLLHLIEQQDRVRLASNGIRQLATFVISDITWWRTQQSRHSVFFHVLTHINTDNRILRIKHEFAQGFAQLRLSHAGRPKEDQRSDWFGRIIQTRSRTLDGFRDNLNGIILSNHTVLESITHLEDTLPLRLDKFLWRNTSPNSNYARNVLCNNFIPQHLFSHVCGRFLFGNSFERRKFRFKIWKCLILELSCRVKLVYTFRLFNVQVHLGNLLLQLRNTIDTSLFGLPPSIQRGRLVSQLF